MHDQYHALELADQFVALETTEPWARERVADAARDVRESGALGTDEDSLRAAESVLKNVDEMRARRS
jgi:hypothetical protein